MLKPTALVHEIIKYLKKSEKTIGCNRFLLLESFLQPSIIILRRVVLSFKELMAIPSGFKSRDADLTDPQIHTSSIPVQAAEA